MQRIRVATANMSRLLVDLVRQGLSADHELMLVAELPADPFLVELHVDAMDVLIVGLMEDGLPDGYASVMTRHPALRVIGLSTEARRAYAYELRPFQVPLGEASPATLAAAVRQMARAGVS